MNTWPIDPVQVALDELDANERLVAERLLADDPTFRAAVDAMRETVARVAAVEDGIWQSDGPPALDTTLFTTSAAPSTIPQPRPRARRRWTLLGAGTAAAVAVAAVVIVGGGDRQALQTIALSPVGDVPGRATIEIASRDMHLVADGLPQLPPKSVYEAWLGRGDGSMVSVGTFTVDAAGHVDGHMKLTVDPSDFSAVDVSVEPDDGNPTHSTRSVFHAAL